MVSHHALVHVSSTSLFKIINPFISVVGTDIRDISSVEVGEFAAICIHMQSWMFHTTADSYQDGYNNHCWDYSYTLASDETLFWQYHQELEEVRI